MSRSQGEYRIAQRRQTGLLLIGALVFLSLAALTAVHTGQRWFDSRQRAAEEELLFIGEQYRQAIESYWREVPDSVHHLPTSIDDLLADKRFPFTRRHLRKAFRDPLAPDRPLVEIRDGPVLIGVRSGAPGTPFRQAGFDAALKQFNGAQSYADWKFVYVPPAAPAAPRARTPVVPPPRSAPGPAPARTGRASSTAIERQP